MTIKFIVCIFCLRKDESLEVLSNGLWITWEISMRQSDEDECIKDVVRNKWFIFPEDME